MSTTIVEDAAMATYDALRTKAASVDRSARMRMTFAGDKAKEALGGLLTNDVVSLATGHGQRAAALTPKGRVIALVRVMDRGDDVLVDADAAAAEGFVAMIRKYVNPRLAKYADVTASTRCVGVYGPQSAHVLAVALAASTDAQGARDALHAIESLGTHASLRIGTGDAAVLVVRSADLGGVGFDCIGSAARIDALEAALAAANVPLASREVVTVARVEAGIPEWGAEIDADTIPQEANLDTLGAISFNKGCYTGQEVVVRIQHRGHVNKHLRQLVASEPMPVGSTVLDAEGKDVGAVRASVVSPTQGPLAIAMVRREVEPGSTVTVRFAARDISARCEAIGYATSS
ncbi:MAG TPA: hypothetical protein VFM71_10160 [Gemmatimonadaceae bacterium]|nr:hypothetical protein [Gemmatimonadaceae bacterium]